MGLHVLASFGLPLEPKPLIYVKTWGLIGHFTRKHGAINDRISVCNSKAKITKLIGIEL